MNRVFTPRVFGNEEDESSLHSKLYTCIASCCMSSVFVNKKVKLNVKWEQGL